MRISIFGLGYIGCVSLACLARNGFKVVGYDVNQKKVDLINKGLPTIVEAEVDTMIQDFQSRISATTDSFTAVLNSDISMICVQTPVTADGHLDTSFIEKAASSIAEALKKKNEFHVVVIRSTVPPGTNERITKLIEQISGKVVLQDFDVVNNPEFLREGAAVEDYFNPAITVVGVRAKNSRAADMLKKVYAEVSGEFLLTETRTAEIIKYVNNSWHAVKIVFANEVGNISHAHGANANEVMDVFCKDTRLNLSSYYFRPGFAFGGPCLPKDLKGFVGLAGEKNISVPLLENVALSNSRQVDFVFNQIKGLGKKRITLLGVSFKPGTDDVRNSTKLTLAKKLHSEGFHVRIHDENVSESVNKGINAGYILEELDGLRSCLVEDLDHALAESEVVILANKEPYYQSLGLKLNEKHFLYELVKYKGEVPCPRIGICW